jgi:hypothetical protein
MHRGDRPDARHGAPHHHGGCSAGFVRPRKLPAPFPPVGAGRRGPARGGIHPRAGQARLHGPPATRPWIGPLSARRSRLACLGALCPNSPGAVSVSALLIGHRVVQAPM